MTQLLLTIIIGIGIAVVATAGALTLFQSARDGVDQQLLWARLEQAAAAIRAKTIIVDGLPVLPMSENSTDNYPAVPTWITSSAFDNNGRRFVYCPFALRDTSVEGTSTTVTGPGYSVKTYNSAITGNRDYVVGAVRPTLAGTPSAAPQGLLGVLISFKPKDTYTASVAVNWCANNNLSVSAGGVITASYSSQTGVVYPITAPQNPIQQAVARRDAITLYVDVATSGDGTGRNTSNYTTLDAAFAQLAALRPHRAKIYLSASPSHSLTSITKTDAGGNDVYNRGNLQQTIYDIEGADSGSTTVTLNLTGDFDLPVNMIWRSLTLAATDTEKVIVPANTKTIIENAVVPNLYVKQGTAWVRGTSALNTSITVTDVGRLVVNGTVTSSVPDQGIKIQPGRVDVLTGAGWTVTATSAASTPSAPVIIYGGGILSNSGSMTITSNGSTQLKSAINVVPGGTLNMNNATLSLNSGSSTIAGDGANRKGAIVMGGSMYMVTSGILFPGGTSSDVAGVVLVDGGKFFLHANSYIGSSGLSSQRPYIGVYDNGGSQVGGSSAGCGAANEPADGNTSCTSGDGGSVVSNIYVVSGGKCWDGSGDPYSLGIVTDQRRHLFSDSDEGDGLYSSPKDTYSTSAVNNLLTHTDSLKGPDWGTYGLGTVAVVGEGISADNSSRTATRIRVSRGGTGVNAGLSYNTAKTLTGQNTATLYVKASGANIGKVVNFWQYNGSNRNVTSITLTGAWQRVTMTNSYSFPGASVSNPFIIGLLVLASGGSSETDVTFDIWAAQLEAGASATTYAPVGPVAATKTLDYRHLRFVNNTDWKCTGGGGGGGGGDSEPNAFSIGTDGLSYGTATATSSNTTPAGYDTAAAISVACTSCPGGGTAEYSINGGAYTSSAGSISPGQNVNVRITFGSNNVLHTATLTIGGVSDTFTATQSPPGDMDPDSFTLTGCGAPSTATTPYDTSTATPIGYDTTAPISISCTGCGMGTAQYSINAGAWTSSAGSITPGQNVKIRFNFCSNATYTADLTIGTTTVTCSKQFFSRMLPAC